MRELCDVGSLRACTQNDDAEALDTQEMMTSLTCREYGWSAGGDSTQRRFAQPRAIQHPQQRIRDERDADDAELRKSDRFYHRRMCGPLGVTELVTQVNSSRVLLGLMTFCGYIIPVFIQAHSAWPSLRG